MIDQGSGVQNHACITFMGFFVLFALLMLRSRDDGLPGEGQGG
ncbi:hypothetical protein [Bradyrhizobium sp. CCBAU 11357]|nr:hypothetical protein [Bradyrhizobium sp. CCBAU 11357]